MNRDRLERFYALLDKMAWALFIFSLGYLTFRAFIPFIRQVF